MLKPMMVQKLNFGRQLNMIYKTDPLKVIILICIFGAGVILGGIIKEPVVVEKIVEKEIMVGAECEPCPTFSQSLEAQCFGEREVVIEVQGCTNEILNEEKIRVKNSKNIEITQPDAKIILDNKEFNTADILKDLTPSKILPAIK